MFSGDIHCLYSPDRTLFCGDGYPDNEEMRTVYLYDFKKKAASRLLKVKSDKPDHIVTAVVDRGIANTQWKGSETDRKKSR